MNVITIRLKWFWLFIVITMISVGFNIFSVTLFQFRIQFLSNPMPDTEITNAFNSASSDVVVPKSFSLKWGDRYYLLLETTKDVKDKLEKLERTKRNVK